MDLKLTSLSVASYWGHWLKAHGVARVFGVPGTETIELIHGLDLSGVEFVLTHHEATAGFAAAMTGHLTGTPGVCLVAGGPGAANITPASLAAHLDRMPLVVVVGDHDHGPNLPAHQRVHFTDLMGSAIREGIVASAETFGDDLERAFRASVGSVPGPVYLAIQSSEMHRPATLPSPQAGEAPRRFTAVDADVARTMIKAARRPIIIMGLQVATARAHQELLDFANRLQAPVADTPQSKGWFPNSHPLYVGTFATHRNDVITDMANASDLVIAVGLDSVEMLKPWGIATTTLDLREPGTTDPAIAAATTVEAPLREMLRVLALESRSAASWPRGSAAKRRNEIQRGLLSGQPRGSILWPQTVVRLLRRALPSNGIITLDVGSHKLLTILEWATDEPDTFLNSSGMSSMGTGLPFAMAARMVFPERTVVALIGDGGLLMYAGELATLVRSNLHVIIIVMADRALQSIRLKQLRRGYPATGTELDGLASIATVARAFGLPARSVRSERACEAAIAEAMACAGPYLIEAQIDSRGYESAQ